MRYNGQVASREALARDVWREPSRTTPLDNVIDVHIARLRARSTSTVRRSWFTPFAEVGSCSQIASREVVGSRMRLCVRLGDPELNCLPPPFVTRSYAQSNESGSDKRANSR
jgi:hypothetical protein